MISLDSSGQVPKAPLAISTLSRLLGTANTLSGSRDSPLIILPGSGLNADTLPPVLDALCPAPANLREIHASCGRWVGNRIEGETTISPNEGILAFGFGGGGHAEHSIWKTQGSEVASVRKLLDNYVRIS